MAVGISSSSFSSTDINTSAKIAAIVSDETGSGALVFGTSPSLTTPNIGVATAAAGSRSQPSLVFSGATTMGFWNDGNTSIRISSSNADWVQFLSTGIDLGTTRMVGWAADTFLSRSSAANVLIGTASAGFNIGTGGIIATATNTYNIGTSTSAGAPANIYAGTSVQTASGGYGDIGGCGLGYNVTAQFIAKSTGAYTFGSSAYNSPDVYLYRGGAGILEQRNGTDAQTFNLFNTFTARGAGTTNLEFLSIKAISNVFTIESFKGSAGGTARDIAFVWGGTDTNGTLTEGSEKFRITTNGCAIPKTQGLYWGSNSSIWVNDDEEFRFSRGVSGSVRLFVAPAGTKIQSDATYAFSSTTNTMDAADTFIGRGGAAGKIVLTGTTPMFLVGGTSVSYPALKRSTTSLQVRLANDSDFTNVQGKLTTHANAATETITPDKTLTLYDAAGTAYKVPCVAA